MIFWGLGSLIVAMLLFRLTRRILVPRDPAPSRDPELDDMPLLGLVEAARLRNAQSIVRKVSDVDSDGSYSAAFELDLTESVTDADIVEDLVRELSKWFDLHGIDANSARVFVRGEHAQEDRLRELWAMQVLTAERIVKLTSVGCELALEFDSSIAGV